MKRAAVVLLGICSIIIPFHRAVAQHVDCRMVETALDAAVELRKLKIKKPVPCELQGRDKVEKYLRDTLKKKIPAERITNEGKAYELLGLIPQNYDYLNNIIKLYTEQLGGYYDTERGAYVMASWLPAAMQMPIAVHELTHALQDQHFHLDAIMDEMHDDSDSLMARSGLVEGDATAVMLDFARHAAGQPSISTDRDVSAFMLQNITGAMLTAGVSSAPPALQAMIIFPYVSGLRFVHRLLRQDGFDAVNKAFHRLPDSTEEILHPQIYLSGKKSFGRPAMPQLPADVTVDVKKPNFEDRLGEFVISTLLSSYIQPVDASEASAGWGGDRLWLFARPDGKYLLLWRLLWDTDKDTTQFFQAITEAYEKRFAVKAEEKSENERVFKGTPVGTVSIIRSVRTVDLTID